MDSGIVKEQYKDSLLTSKVIKAAMAVHGILGNGFQEVIYQRGMAIEMESVPIAFAREFEMPVFYRNRKIGSRRVDFLVEGRLSVELKALIKLEKVHLAQAMNYLEAFNLEVGLLLNFGSASLEVKRFHNKKFKEQTR